MENTMISEAIRLNELYLHLTSNEFVYGMWALPRLMTKHWGSGQIWKRLCQAFGSPDVAFGKTDGIPEGVFAVDKNNGYEWQHLPFKNDTFAFGYWDPPYDRLYKKEGQEIWRVCRKLAILHTHIYPTSWFDGAKRVAGIGVTMGPLKQIRSIQVFEKQDCLEAENAAQATRQLELIAQVVERHPRRLDQHTAEPVRFQGSKR